MWPCPAPSNVRLSRLATVWQGILEGSSHSFSWYKVSMCAQLETQDGDMEAMRLPASLDQGVRLRRQSQEGSSNQVRSGPFSLVINSRRVTGGFTCLLQNTYTAPPKAVMATVERLQRGWEHLKPVPRESCRGWAGFGKETCRRWAGFQIIAGSLPGLLALPLLPLPASATLLPVLATSLCWRMIPCIGDPHSGFGLLDYQLYLQETEQLWGVQTLLARNLTAGKQQGQDFNMGPDFRFLVLYCLESRLILYTKSPEIFEYFSLPIGKASELFGSVFL